MSASPLTLRPIARDDADFLLQVYAGTREEELAPLPWTDAEKQAFVRMQFDAQHAYYEEHYAGAAFDVVVVGERPVGRLYVARWEDEIRIVDIALLPEERGNGTGTRLLNELLREAAAAGKRLSIHVEKMNRARALYERLGFESVADRGVYLLMEARPDSGTEEPTIDRRGFVKLAAGGAALLVAGPLVSAGTARAARRTPLKIGVMVPTQGSYALMGDSLVRGLRLALRTSPVNASLTVRPIERGYGGAHGTAAALLDDDVDLLVAGISAPVARLVTPLAQEHGIPLLVANVGAHVVPPDARDAYVLHNSLLFWQASFAAGSWSANTLGRRAVLATSRADAGYDALYAFRRSFEAAGGSVAASIVTGAGPGETTVAELLEAIAETAPDVVYASYSGAEAVELVRAYAASGLRRRAPLVCTGFATEDHQLGRVGTAAVGVRSLASWTASRATPANQAFTRSFRESAGRAPDAFAALGYDTGLLVVSGVERAARRGLGARRLVEALAGARVESPRGRLVVDGRTNTVSGPLALRTVRRRPTRLANVELRTVPAVPPFPQSLAPLAAATASAYVNEYLCA